MLLKFKDYLPDELKEKYFDFSPRNYSEEEFYNALLTQIKKSFENCRFYRDVVCKRFDYSIPDEINADDLDKIPYVNTNLFKKFNKNVLNLMKVPPEEIALFSCSSSTSGDPSIMPRTLEDFDQIQYNSIKIFTEFFRWKSLTKDGKKPLVFNFAPSRHMMSFMAKKNAKGFEYVDKTRYFSACMNKPWEYLGHEEYLVKVKLLKTIWAIISTFSARGGFVLDITKMLKMIEKVLDNGSYKNMEISKIIFGGSPLLMNNMFENRLLKEDKFYDLKDIGFAGCGGGGWDGVKGEAKMDSVNKSKFIGYFEKIFNIKPENIADIYAFTESPTLFGAHWSEKYQDFLYHCPDTSRIIARDIKSLQPVNIGQEGLLEVITPYGVNGAVNQAMLVDDIVELVSVDKCPECGYQGATFRVLGRLKSLKGESCSSLIDWLH